MCGEGTEPATALPDQARLDDQAEGVEAESEGLWRRAAYALIGLYLLAILLTFLDYGITYDEGWHSIYGDHILRWYSSLFRDTGALTYWTLPLQGGFFDALARFATRLSPGGVYETTHFVNALFGLLTVIGAWKLGAFMSGPRAGLLSALFLLLTPRFYGHAFNNPGDIPMAALSVFAIYYLVRMTRSLPRPPGPLVWKLGIAIGLALAVRIGALLLLAYVGLAFSLWLGRMYVSGGDSECQGQARIGRTVARMCYLFLAISGIAYVVMLIWWPAAQTSPILQPARGVWHATHFIYPIQVFFEGVTASNMDLPWYYVSKWFMLTLPEYYFATILVGLIFLARAVSGKTRLLHTVRADGSLEMSVVLTAAAFPLAYTAITSPVEYDGIRHYLFVLPPLAVIAGVAMDRMLSTRMPKGVRTVVSVVVSGSLLLTTVDLVRLHPHQYVYFNRIFGKGVASAATRYEMDYWGNSFKEGAEWLVEHYAAVDGEGQVEVASCLNSLSTSHYLTDSRFLYVGTYHSGQQIPDGVVPDILLATNRWKCNEILPGKVIHTVTRMGAPLLYIIEVCQDGVVLEPEGR